MHIALNGWFWDQPTTGSGQYLAQVLSALVGLGADLRFTLILPDRIKNPQAIPAGVGVIQAPIRWPGNLGKVWFEQRSFPAVAQRIKADLAHVPYWAPPLKSAVPLVVSILDLIPLLRPEYRQGVLPNLYTSLVVAGSGGVGQVLTLSEASKKDIVEHLKLPAEKITPTLLAVGEAYTPHPDPQRDAAVRQKYDLPEEFALYFGGFDRRKNVNTLLLAWTYVGQPMGETVPLILAGRPPQRWGSAVFPDLPAYIQKLGLQNKVRWLGEIDEADKPSLYRLAKVFVWLSLYEGFGLPPLEAMACGTPVVAGNVSSTSEVVGEAAYLVDPNDARTIGGAILALLVQADFHQYMSNLARGQASKFSWRKTAEQTLAAYQKTLGR